MHLESFFFFKFMPHTQVCLLVATSLSHISLPIVGYPRPRQTTLASLLSQEPSHKDIVAKAWSMHISTAPTLGLDPPTSRTSPIVQFPGAVKIERKHYKTLPETLNVSLYIFHTYTPDPCITRVATAVNSDSMVITVNQFGF